jgi:hypothetical protein
MNSTPDPAEAPTSPAPAAEEVGESVEQTLDAPVADPDPALLEAHALALSALAEITPAATVGDAAGYRVEPDGVVSLRFENRLSGYPGWFWTVSLARVEGADPTVLEVELLPGDDALLAPDWVPWAVRLADYQAAQVALAEAADGAEDEDADELDDVDDLDAADFDDDGSPILHAGDLDGVDIDELDEDAEDDDTDDLDDEDDSDDDEPDGDDSDDDEDDSDEDEDDADADDDEDD